MGDVALEERSLSVEVRGVQTGTFTITPDVTTTTYDPTLDQNIQKVSVQVVAPAGADTVPMQPTGVTLMVMLFAALLVGTGLLRAKK